MNKSKSILTKLIIGLVLFFGFALGLSIYKTDNLMKNLIVLKLNKSLRNNVHSIYDYSLDNIRLKFWLGDLRINGFEIFIKPSALDSLRRNNISKRQLLEGQFGSLHIKGFDFSELLLEDKIIARKILLESPDIRFFLNTDAPKNKKNKFDLDSVFSIMKPNLAIEKLELSNASFEVIDVSKDSINTFGIDEFSFSLNNLKIDSSTLLTPLRVSYSSFECGSGNSYVYINDDYDFKMKDFSYNSNDKMLNFEGISIAHNLNKKEYIKETADDTPLYRVSIDKLEIDLSLGDIMVDDVLKIKKVELDKLDVFVYQSKKNVIRPLKTKPLVASMIRSIPVPIIIKEIELKDCFFTYEFQDKAMKEKTLKIDFTRSDILISNVTNNDLSLQENHFMNVSAVSYFMDKGRVDLNIKFDLTNKNEYFIVNGHLGQMAFSDANSVVKSLAPVMFVEGKVHGVDFNFKANNYKSTGLMDFHYSDVRLSVLKEDSKQRKNKPVLSMLLNNLIKKNNKPNTNKYKTGIIDARFNQKKSILNYLWQSVKSGLFSSLSHSKRK